MIELKRELAGPILDVGGGGEGVIGQLYGRLVVAIDNSKEELDEAPDGFVKLVMDASAMTFNSDSFESATFFYSLMFMDEAVQQAAICEAARVIKPNGEIHIWDCRIDSAYPNPFCIDVDALLPDRRIKTTYGVIKSGSQSIKTVCGLCEAAGLRIDAAKTDDLHFYIKCRKR